ncbi:PASTA domain-containing protein [Streptomyces sp. NPDC126497]|uniref:PASTA domain-containing protein n=1 Tax=Streptomyces sp. NPDC126497 TaxID=3155313 RepID=UPI003325BD2E
MSSPYTPPTAPVTKQERPWFKKKRALIPGGFVALIILGGIAGGGESGSGSTEATPAATKSVTATPTPESPDESPDLQSRNKQEQDEPKERTEEAPKSAQAEESEPAVVPDVVGMNHREAQSLLRSEGFLVNEEDASPEGRWILDNSNWKVCRQDPGPGATDALRVAIFSVKLSESC